VALPIYLSVVLVLGGLLATVKAAPIMMSLRRIGDDTSALQKAFEGFRRWGNVRAIFQILAFLANVWALLAVLGCVYETCVRSDASSQFEHFLLFQNLHDSVILPEKGVAINS
jgi:hypothetical protein